MFSAREVYGLGQGNIKNIIYDGKKIITFSFALYNFIRNFCEQQTKEVKNGKKELFRRTGKNRPALPRPWGIRLV